MAHMPIGGNQEDGDDGNDANDQVARMYFIATSQYEVAAMNDLKELGSNEFVKRLLSGLVHKHQTLVSPFCHYFIVLWKLFPIFRTETVISLSFANEGYIIHQLYKLIVSYPMINGFQEAIRPFDLFGNIIHSWQRMCSFPCM
jgi:hypothetical protein